MFRRIGRFLSELVNVLFKVALFGNVFLIAILIGTVARQELSYHLRYNNAYLQVEREHERQIVVAQIIDSQNAWADQAELLKFQYLEQRALTEQINIQYRLLNNEYYHFMKTLQEIDMEAFTKVMAQLQKAKPIFPWFGEQEPTPAVPESQSESKKENEA